MPIGEAKRRLRREMQARRRAVGPAERAAAGDGVADHVLRSPEFGAALRVALYAALPDEIPTDRLLRAVLASGRVLLLPRMRIDGALEFAAVTDLGGLRGGRFGTLEPPASEPPSRLAPGDLVLAPGVAFDRRGGRLGRGLGAYDRSLPTGARAPRCFGLAFAFQLVPVVPEQGHDRRVDAVATEVELVRAGPTRDLAADPG
jgi:5-formyltetrahydrofolate cyclo-ligase